MVSRTFYLHLFLHLTPNKHLTGYEKLPEGRTNVLWQGISGLDHAAGDRYYAGCIHNRNCTLSFEIYAVMTRVFAP